LPIALKQGRLGWEVTDLKITLIDGGYHHIHTHPLDFIVATPWAIQDGLEKGGSRLLEPVMEITFYLPEEHVGRVMSDVVAMRGEVVDTHVEGKRTVLQAFVPAASCLDYSEQLRSLSGGRADMTMRLHGYQDAPIDVHETRTRTSVDPLDTSKYILAARSALEGGIFNL
nr:GTP-binding protein [Clostridiales bacterium]